MSFEKYERPRINAGDLRTPVVFYKYSPDSGPMPGESEDVTLYQCFAKVDEVWRKDLEQAKANGTLSDLTLTIRDPHGSYFPDTKHYLSIQARGFSADTRYRVKHVQSELQDQRYMKVIAEVVT